MRGPSAAAPCHGWFYQRVGEVVDKTVCRKCLAAYQPGRIMASSWPPRVVGGYAGANEHGTGGVKRSGEGWHLGPGSSVDGTPHMFNMC